MRSAGLMSRTLWTAVHFSGRGGLTMTSYAPQALERVCGMGDWHSSVGKSGTVSTQGTPQILRLLVFKLFGLRRFPALERGYKVSPHEINPPHKAGKEVKA